MPEHAGEIAKQLLLGHGLSFRMLGQLANSLRTLTALLHPRQQRAVFPREGLSEGEVVVGGSHIANLRALADGFPRAGFVVGSRSASTAGRSPARSETPAARADHDRLEQARP